MDTVYDDNRKYRIHIVAQSLLDGKLNAKLKKGQRSPRQDHVRTFDASQRKLLVGYCAR